MATYYSTIGTEEQQRLLNDYVSYVNSNDNLYPLFKLGKEYQLWGYKVGFHEYVGMVSQVGVTHWKVRFGYQPADALQTGKSPFKLVISGADINGNMITPNYELTHPFNTGLLSEVPTGRPPEGITSPVSTIVPEDLISPWMGAWLGLISEENVPQSMTQVPDGTLKGYTFDSDDFPQRQSELPGTLGIMLVMVKETLEAEEVVSFYYDISSPCPPTC